MSARPSTPPPSTRMPAVPDTPRWGYDDNYEPYPATRAAVRQRAAGTTVPSTPRKAASGAQGSKIGRPVYTGTAFSGGSTYTPPSTVATKRTYKLTHLGDDLSKDVGRDGARSPTGFQSSTAMKTEMPSTPERTPRQKKGLPIPKSGSNSSLGSISRNLFSSRIEDAMPSPRKHVKYGLSLGEVEEEEIAIFTDSKERIPEKDAGFDNPFFGPGRRISASATETPAKGRKGKKADTDGAQTGAIEEKDTSDGYWAAFRGKKVWKKFETDDNDGTLVSANMDDEFAAQLDATVPESLRGPATGSRDFKPRTLFPTARQAAAKAAKQREEEQKQLQQVTTDDEEADTEHEAEAETEHEEAETDIEDTEAAAPTPKPKAVEKGLKTPRAVKIIAPLSPPTTARTTRSKDVRSNDVASASFSSTGSHSKEFQSWQSAKPQSKKRDASAVADVDLSSHKRTRSHAA